MDFNADKIADAILMALQTSGVKGFEVVDRLTAEVITDLAEHNPSSIPHVEIVEETIEYILFKNNFKEAGKTYLAHRLKKERIREEKDELMGIVTEILKETKRENANVGNSPAAKMLQIASTASRLYYMNQLIPKEFALAHTWGEIHIHDLDYYGKTINCLQIDLSKLLSEGFNTGYGYVRPPKKIITAAALSAVVIQSNQNDMYGGQSYPAFDRSLGEFIKRECPDTTEEDALQAMEAFVSSMNTMHSRAGGNVPFSSINIGTDTTKEGRMITRTVLQAFSKGLGRGETPLFPNIVFRLKENVNINPEDPNYDLFKLAMETASRRMNPTFSFMDASFNKRYRDEVAYMGCRSRVMANRVGPEVTASRGNIAPVTINLPGLAIITREKDNFFKALDHALDLAGRQLIHRFNILGKLKAKEFPFLMMQKNYLGSENMKDDDEIREAIKHGTLAVGFIGLAEALVMLTGKHHGEDSSSWDLGYEIVSRIRKEADMLSEKYNLNFAAYATPAEGLSGRFTAIDKKEHGVIKGVTDRGYYTNSFHIPVYYEISAFEKIEKEAPFHKLCNAGHITVVELPAPPVNNIQAFEKIVRHMHKNDIGYAGINFPIDECRACGISGIFDKACPSCKSGNIRRIRRITGYLSTIDRFNDAKKAELLSRVRHSTGKATDIRE